MLDELEYAVSVRDDFFCFDKDGEFVFLTFRSEFDKIIQVNMFRQWNVRARKEVPRYFIWCKSRDVKDLSEEIVLRLSSSADIHFRVKP